MARWTETRKETYFGREFDVVFVVGQIDDRAVATDIEDDIVVLSAHFGELLGAGHFGLDGLINQEFDAFVVLERLSRFSTAMHKTTAMNITCTLYSSTGGLAPLGEAKSTLYVGAKV